MRLFGIHASTAVAAMAAMLSMAGPAQAFDPDTPMGGEPKATFPITLQADGDSRVRMAFAAAFGVRPILGAEPTASAEVDGRTYMFVPAALHMMENNRAALLSVGSFADAGHSDIGVNAIHYLRSSPTGWVREGSWFGLGSVGTVGNGATSWAFTNLLGKNPYLITAGGGVWQGCLVSTAVVTEMTPEKPVDRGSFTDAMSSGAGLGQEEAQYDGHIVAATPDRSFTVGYSGSKALKQTYVLRGGEYKLVGKDRIPGC